MSSKRRAKRARPTQRAESLESRCLLAGNIHMVGVSLLDQNFNPDPNPSIGSTVYLKIVFTTTGLAAGTTYDVSPTFNGVTFSYDITWGAGSSNTDTWEFDFFDTIARTGPTSASATLDMHGNVAETDETDNTGVVNYTPIQLPITGKMTQPIGLVAERNYSYSNYVDQDPTSGFADYRGGPDTYDGHDGIDMTVPTFAYMDAGTPIIATLGGTVVFAQDGYYDRNDSGSFDAGNFVEIDSGNGYQEYYYHLREGSVGVQVGQTVQQGQVIGLMGASGNAFGAHLHFGLINGSAIDPFQDPFTYWQNPAPYQGDVDVVTDSGVTNYDPSPILNAYERPPDYKNYAQQAGQKVYSWFLYDSAAGEPLTITYYRPNGMVYLSPITFTTTNNAGGYTFTQTTLPATPDLGTWQVAMTINGVELARNSFTVTASGVAGARVDKDGTFIANNRETPIDGGTFSQGSTATAVTLTVSNFGNASMTLGTPTLPPGWLAVTSDPLATSLAAGASDTFSVKLDTSTLGYRYGFLSFTTNDPNAPIYSFALGGTVNPTGAPAVSIYTRDISASETGQQPGVVRVTRTGDTTNPLVVNLSITGTATNGTDYTTNANTVTNPNTVTIPAGQSSASVIITPIDDASPESTETATVSLGASANYTAGVNTSATINIADNDSAGTASITGTVYLDKNFNTYQDSGEGIVQGVTLFLDTNSNGILDTGEPQTTSSATGAYSFTSLPAGRYNLRSTGSNYILSTPVGSYSVATGQTLTVNLGAFPISFNGTSGNDAFTIAPASTANRELITAGGVTYNAIRSQLPSLTFSGAGGNGTLTLDASLLSLPPGLLSATPLTFSGGTGVNALTIINTNAAQDLNIQSTQLSIASTNIALSGIQSFILDGTANSAITLHSLTISSVPVSLPSGKNLVLALATISVMGSGSLNLANNDMIATAMNVNDVKLLLATGYAGGTWTGNGINSSSAASTPGTTLGLAQASDIGSPATFDNQSITGTAVLVRYTLGGDANLDRSVGNSDIYIFSQNWLGSGKRFSQGDFSYDGTVNAHDLGILALNWYQTMSTPVSAPPLAPPIDSVATLPTPILQPSGPPPQPTPQTVYLSDLTPTSVTNGWGQYEKDKSNGEAGSHDGHTITLNGKRYDKGLGVHAGSTQIYNLNGQYTQFLADIGVDDEVGSKGSVVFQVYLDNVKVYDSKTMTGSSASKSISLDVTGKKQLKLVVTDAGNGKDFDHADWTGARLLAANSTLSITAAPISGSSTDSTKPKDLITTVNI